jgi:hypothetical protein
MSRRTTAHAAAQQSLSTELPTEVLSGVAELASESTPDQPTAPRPSSRHRPPAVLRRPALYLAAAVAGGIMVNVLVGGQPGAQAEADQPVSVAAQLDLSSQQSDTPVTGGEVTERLGELAANRSEREDEQAAAAQSQAAADQAAIDAKAAADAQAAADAKAAADAQAAADAKAVEEAAAQAAAARKPAAATTAADSAGSSSSASGSSASGSSASGSFQDYALSKLGGDASEMSCLESLWGKESHWNPKAQNPSSTAYGIPQFLDSTWAGTGIAKTSDGYRQIDAGLIYIDSRYGSPCGAWSHSKSTGWY